MVYNQKSSELWQVQDAIFLSAWNTVSFIAAAHLLQGLVDEKCAS